MLSVIDKVILNEQEKQNVLMKHNAFNASFSRNIEIATIELVYNKFSTNLTDITIEFYSKKINF